jgi:hypothetical protein
MEKPKESNTRPQDQNRSPDRDSHGTKIERVPGPGPKDAGKGAAGKEATNRVERKQ